MTMDARVKKLVRLAKLFDELYRRDDFDLCGVGAGFNGYGYTNTPRVHIKRDDFVTLLPGAEISERNIGTGGRSVPEYYTVVDGVEFFAL